MSAQTIACQNCRARRVKCDGAVPCLKCRKIGQTCLSTAVAKEAGFSIHLENRYASGKAKRPRGPRSSIVVLLPHFDIQKRALAYYLQYHLQTHSDELGISGGFSACIASWYRSGRSCPMTDLALSSLALACFSRTHRHGPAASEASSEYYRLVRLAQSSIVELKGSRYDAHSIDAALLAASVMGRYESVTYVHPGSTPVTSTRIWSHHDGAMAFLKIWDPQLDHTEPTFVMKHIRRDLVKSALLRNATLPDFIQNGARFGEHGLELEFDQMVVRTINLHHILDVCQRTTNLSWSEIEDLLCESRQLEDDLIAWADRLSKASLYQRKILTSPGPFPQLHFYSSTVYDFSQLEYAANWAEYLAMRMIVCSISMRLLTLTYSPCHQRDSEWHEKNTTLSELADDLASTTPFCLERFKPMGPVAVRGQSSVKPNTDEDIKPYLASSIVWPLTIACGLQGINSKHQAWFKAELAMLGRTIGDGVLESAESSEWPVF